MTKPSEILEPTVHPTTSERFVTSEIRRDQDVQTYKTNPPAPPSREVATEWDDDGPVAWKTLSEREFEEATRAYDTAIAAWKKTGGTVKGPGPTTIEGTFTTARGDTARGIWTGDRWHWIEITTPSVR